MVWLEVRTMQLETWSFVKFGHMISIIEFQWPFSYDSEFYAILFPKFLYLVNSIIFNSSIFLTIVIAYERNLILLKEEENIRLCNAC